MKNSLLNLYKKEATQKVLASLLSIVIGLFVGAVVVAIVGLSKKNIGIAGAWDGVRLIFVLSSMCVCIPASLKNFVKRRTALFGFSPAIRLTCSKAPPFVSTREKHPISMIAGATFSS